MIDPPPAFLHLRAHRLRGEELVAQVHRHALVPVIDGDILDLVPIVVGGVVDQHADGPVLLGRGLDRLAQILDVAQVDMDEIRRADRPWRRCA